MTYKNIVEAFEGTGLKVRGGFQSTNEYGLGDIQSVVMIGNAGPSMWSRFKKETDEKQRVENKHPLDQWTEKIVKEKANKLDAVAIFPFQGPPYYPFQKWAIKSENLFTSPLGILIHPEYGLWHAYRGALGFTKTINFPVIAKQSIPCENCTDKPCLTTCPVQAFDKCGFNDGVCATYLKTDEAQKSCMQHNCQARLACPIGQEYHYGKDHGRFHMEKFLSNRWNNGCL